MEGRLKKLIYEEVKRLFERESKTSVDAERLIRMASKYKFLLPYKFDGSKYTDLVFYYAGNDLRNAIRDDFYNFSDLVKRCGWVIKQYGNYYDGLRNMYSRFTDSHPEFGQWTFFACVEPEYGTEMDEYFGDKDDEVYDDIYDGDDDADYWKKGFDYNSSKRLSVGYKRGIFYHITDVKNLKGIMAHGLVPKNGGGLTNWRNSSGRIYLSLFPDFSEIETSEGYEDSDGDMAILRIDLRRVMRNFKFYVDYDYENAVYTYSHIPPQFIEVIGKDEIRGLETAYKLKNAAHSSLKSIINTNCNGMNHYEQKEWVRGYRRFIHDALLQTIRKYLKAYRMNYENNDGIEDAAKNEIDNFLASE